MITMKLSSPQSYGLWDGDRLLAECAFSMEKDALLIERIDVFEPVEGLNAYDALLRAVVSFMEPFSPKSVRCRVPELFDELTALRFVRKGDAVESTPEEVMRHLCCEGKRRCSRTARKSAWLWWGQAPPA